MRCAEKEYLPVYTQNQSPQSHTRNQSPCLHVQRIENWSLCRSVRPCSHSKNQGSHARMLKNRVPACAHQESLVLNAASCVVNQGLQPAWEAGLHSFRVLVGGPLAHVCLFSHHFATLLVEWSSGVGILCGPVVQSL